jgi:D-alanyl-lipoteichoic acid acyltransferase DltB (MBOAT superfamily)
LDISSPRFFFFLAATFAVFHVTRDRFRWLVLLLASYAFYAALKSPHLLFALASVTVVTYACGVGLARCEGPGRRGALFWAGVAANLAILVYLKYLPFLSRNLHELLARFSAGQEFQESPLLLSVGVSFYVFQGISYLIDVYSGTEKPEYHFGYLALYLGFFPKLLQGPIERAGDLVPQLRNRYVFSYENARSGLLLIAWGLLKKVVIADRLGAYVDSVYGDVHSFAGLPLALATYFYAGQLYYDFSGYTDMAMGAARLFNVNLTQNFQKPYMATSIVDFWRRWHISFSRWILDYIFKPLQMQFRDRKTAGTALALLITFLACGFWHGANWTFIVWGGLHGIYMAASAATGNFRKDIRKRWLPAEPRLQRFWQTAVTFHLVCFSWIFFRSNSLEDAGYVVTHLFSGVEGAGSFLLSRGPGDLAVAAASILIVALVSSLDNDAIAGRKLRKRPALQRWAVYYLLAVYILYFAAEKQGKFIYFQF